MSGNNKLRNQEWTDMCSQSSEQKESIYHTFLQMWTILTIHFFLKLPVKKLQRILIRMFI